MRVRREMELWGGLLDGLKQDMHKGTSSTCYVSSYLRQRAESGIEDAPGTGLTEDGWLKDVLLAYTAGTVLEAGSDTTASTIQSFILFMLSHPHVLRTVREEIDRVVGEDRLPEFDDEENLPYLIACIKETLRRRPPTIMGTLEYPWLSTEWILLRHAPTPIGIPHLADEDDEYNGYLIPKGSTVIGNVWAIHMDPIKYPNPTAYDPERFLRDDKKIRWGSGPESRDRDQLRTSPSSFPSVQILTKFMSSKTLAMSLDGAAASARAVISPRRRSSSCFRVSSGASISLPLSTPRPATRLSQTSRTRRQRSRAGS